MRALGNASGICGWRRGRGRTMFRVRLEATRWLRWGFFSFVTVGASAFAIASADARARGNSEIDNPRYASFVLDANSGAPLRQSNADSLRHPASLTKIMTLYLLFEKIDAGKLKLNSPLLI